MEFQKQSILPKVTLGRGASLIAQLVKNLPAMKETLVRFLGQEDPLEKGQATHSSILGLPLCLSQQRIHLQYRRPGFNPWVGKIRWRRERLPTPVFQPGEFYGLVHGIAKSQTRLSDFHFYFTSHQEETFHGQSILEITRSKLKE